MASVYVLHRLRIPEKKKNRATQRKSLHDILPSAVITSTFQISHKRI